LKLNFMKTSDYPDFPKVFLIIGLFDIPEYIREYAFSKNTDSIKCAKTSQLYFIYTHNSFSFILFTLNQFVSQSIEILFD
jgi:hypothetical protein